MRMKITMFKEKFNYEKIIKTWIRQNSITQIGSNNQEKKLLTNYYKTYLNYNR